MCGVLTLNALSCQNYFFQRVWGVYKIEMEILEGWGGYFSGAPVAQRSAKRSPILIWERKGNPSMNFLMVIMASGFALGVYAQPRQSRARWRPFSKY